MLVCFVRELLEIEDGGALEGEMAVRYVILWPQLKRNNVHNKK